MPGIWGAEEKVLYANDFEKLAVDAEPDDVMILDGEFLVKELDGDKVLQLAGMPIHEFGILLGPSQRENWEISAEITSDNLRRRKPRFGVGLGGVRGYKLRLATALNQLELIRGEDKISTASLSWENSKPVHFRFRVLKTGEDKWQVEGKAWQSKDEPKDWQIKYVESKPPTKGMASIWGTPYSSRPIYFDDVKLIETKDAK